MALNVTQVNQAFLGLLGRPATGAEAAKFAGQLDAATLAQTLLTDASFKNELSVETLSFKTVDLQNTDPAAFVESLYTALLGRASDAEGKAFWLSVAGITPNRADVVSQFIAAVQAQEGTADANAFASIQAEDKALASAWVESLYNNLAGRASDAEGLDFWTNAIVSFTMTPAQVAASFAAALALQGNTTEDGQNFAAKLGVADNFTANFKDFNSLVTANEKAEQLKNLVTMMNGVNKDSQVDQYTQEITKITDEYQKITAVQFTAADDDNLGIDPETGESNLKGAANFTGTYNLTDAAKGTIQSSDSATGTEAYLTDTLTVNVTGYDKTTHDTFNLSELPSTTSIEKLSINNGAATVSGSISGDFEYINVNGTGSFNIDATTSNADGFKDIVLNSAANKDGSNSFATAQNAVSIKAGAGNDNIDLRIDATTAATIAKSLSTGAGKDNVVANIGKDATADLGAGDDTFSGFLGQAAKLNAGAGDDLLAVWGAGYRSDNNKNPIAEVEIDGGTGTDTLDLTRGLIDGILGQQNTDYLGVKSIKGIEKMIVGNGTTLYANAISGQKIELSGTSLVLNASGASTIDLTKLSNAKDEDVAVRITNVKNGSISLETGNKNFNAIKETIELSSEATKVSVKGFEKGNDHVAIENATATAEELFTHSITGTTTGINTNLVNANEIFFVSLKEKITKNDLNKLLDTATFSNLTEKDVFYVVATDSAEVYGGTGKNSTAKIYKIEVGKDLKVGKLDQMATVNVADKAQLSAQDFGAGTPTPVPTPTEEVNLSNKTVAADGSVTVLASDFAGYDANAAIKVDLPATATKVNLDGVNVKAVQVSGLQANAEVVVGSGSVIDTLSSTENVALKYTVAAGAKVNTIIGRDLDDTIDTSAVAAGSITGTINGGAGNDTLIISGDGLSNLTSLQSIEKIVVSGTSISAKALSANAASGVTTALSTQKAAGATLEVKATAADTNINLANLVQDTTDSGDVSLNITGVASNANVALGAADTKETVNLGASLGVVVTGVKAGDTVVSDNFAGITGSFAELKGTIEAGKAYFTSNTTVTDAASAAAALSAQLATITSGKAIVAVNNGANAYVFAVNGAAANKLTLVATLDNTFSVQDSIANGALAFDGSSPEPEPTAGSIVYDATESRFKADVSGAQELSLSADELTKGPDATDLIITAANGSAISFAAPSATSRLGNSKVTTIETRGSGDITLNDANLARTNVTSLKDLANNATFNLATANGKVTSVDLGAGNDTLNLSAKYSALTTIDLGEGNNTLNITAEQAKLATIKAGVGIDTVSIDGKQATLATVDLGAGNDSVVLGSKFANTKALNVSGGTGDDKLDISAVKAASLGAKLTFNAGEGTTDTVLLGAETYTTDKLALEGVDKIIAAEPVVSGSTTTYTTLDAAIIAPAQTTNTEYKVVNDLEIDGEIVLKVANLATKIDLAKVSDTDANAKITIDATSTLTHAIGSSAFETLSISGDTTSNITAAANIKDIDAIKANGTDSKVKGAIFADNYELTTIDGALEVTYATNLDLSNVNSGTATVTISDVKSTDTNDVSITLTKAPGISDIVKLGQLTKNSGDITINGATSNDIIDVKLIQATSDVSFAAKWVTPVQITAKKAYYIDNAEIKAKADADQLDFADLFTEGASSAKGYAFVQTSTGINIYEVDSDGTSTASEALNLLGSIVGVSNAIGAEGSNQLIIL